MQRKEKLAEFMGKYNNVSFTGDNIPKILENLKKADEDNCLRQFFLNKKPYISAFPFVIINDQQMAARGKDQVSIVFALNLYGAEHPGFALKVNTLLKELAAGSSKEFQSVLVLMRAQMELQQLEISLINFADEELLHLVNNGIHKLKGLSIALGIACLVGGAIAMPGFTMLGLIPLTFVSIGVFIYAFMKLPFWLGIKRFSQEEIAAAARPVGEAALMQAQ